MARTVIYILINLVFYYGSILATHDEKRILLTEPDYADNLQLHRDIQTLKSAMETIKQTAVSQSTLTQKQKTEIGNLQIKTAEIANLKTKLQQQTTEIANLQIKTAEIANLKTKLQQQTTEIANLQIKTAEIANSKTKLQQQTTEIANLQIIKSAEIANLQTKSQQREKAQMDLETKLQKIISSQSSVYTQWGRKTCTRNGTELVYTGLGGGGSMGNKGRSATPVCVPHDPDLGPIRSKNGYSTMYGMEYNDAVFGNNNIDKDVPCAVCLAIHRTSIMMVPGKFNCYKGWTTEYQGILASGHHADPGASSYICVDHSPEVLEGGVQNENGYTLFPVKAYCGSLKCPPYVQNSTFHCVVCTK